jgi:hypothetical protein
MGSSTEEFDAEALLRELLAPWRDVSWEALDELEAAPPSEDVRAVPSGRRYRVKLQGYWDMEPWESDFYVVASVYGESGFRKRVPYQDSVDYGGEDLPPEPPPTTRWIKGRLGRWRLKPETSD